MESNSNGKYKPQVPEEVIEIEIKLKLLKGASNGKEA